MKTFVLILILFPTVILAQPTTDDYAIYSKYLKVFTERKHVKKIFFVVNELTTASNDVNDIVNNLRKYHNDKSSSSNINFLFREFTPILTKDTLWVPLIAKLSHRTILNFKIENKFSSNLQTVIIDSVGYNKYFRHFKSSKQIDKNWARFHKQYPMPSALIELSSVSSDGKRAVFYFSVRCGGLCGDGDLVFFSKQDGEWKFLASATLWYN